MVRKAEELKSLDELNLSARTRTYLRRNFDSIGDIVMEGRIIAFKQDRGTQLVDKAPKWKIELVSALKDAGFVRPAEDFVMSFSVAALYATIYGETLNYGRKFITYIGQLSNAQYETFRSLTCDEIERVKLCLDKRLTEKESKVIHHRFGLYHCDGTKDMESVGRYLNITRERVRQLEAKALRKLRHINTELPAILDATEDMNEVAEKLNAELEELYRNPAFARADEITRELEKMKRLPFKYACKCLRDDTADQIRINELDLSVRTYYCLKRVGIDTVRDVIDLPKNDWLKIKNFGHKSLRELIEKMHSKGYVDFDVEIPPASHR